jgi:antibiotic biosynthesis monooxygenase (ABM) superfamily enzyme
MNDVHTAVVARKVKRSCELEYEKWLGRLECALHHAPGYDGMTAISSPDPQGTVKTLLIRFVSAKALSDWEHSTIRLLLAEDGNRFSTAFYKTAPGVETFFSIPGSTSAPPRWKMCVLTIPTVYVLINVVLFFLLFVPGIAKWPPQVRMVPVVCIMTLLLTYVALPALSELFAPWLFSRATPSTTKNFEALKSEGRTL